MDPVGWAAVIVALGTATASILAAWRTHKEIRQTHILLNSRLDALLEVTRAAAYARGRAAGPEAGGGHTGPAR